MSAGVDSGNAAGGSTGRRDEQGDHYTGSPQADSQPRRPFTKLNSAETIPGRMDDKILI